MRPINRCLNKTLTDICQKTIQLETLNVVLHDCLPETLRQHCHVGNFANSCLLLTVHDPIWATQLRYELPNLRDQLRQKYGLYQLRSIDVTVTTIPQIKNKQVKSTPILSEATKKLIIASGDVCKYEPLRQALYRLGKR